MKFKNQLIIIMIISSLFFTTTVSVEATDETKTITDGTGDVISTDANENIEIITYSPEIDVNGLDIKEATYTQQGDKITLTLQVKGSILDHGKYFDESQLDENYTSLKLDFVSYQFVLTTSAEDYSIIYTNKTCNFSSNLKTYDLPSSDFSVVGDTLTITFPSTIAIETYDSLSVDSIFTKIDFAAYLSGDLTGAFFLMGDSAPNPELTGVTAKPDPKVGTIGEAIKFNGTVDISTGQPPYIFNWTFGDGSSIYDTQNPTHAYTKSGNYTYNLTVTDHTGVIESASGYINIIQKGGSGSSPPMLLFFAIILVIIVIAAIIIFWIIRR